MAAANTLFWTERGWDGSEQFVNASIPYCARLPKHARISLISQEMAKTVIVTLQGLQAVVLLASSFGGSAGLDRQQGRFKEWTGLDTIFAPLAVIGLLRLPCCLWLTDDFAYYFANDSDPILLQQQRQHCRPPRIDVSPASSLVSSSDSLRTIFTHGARKPPRANARYRETSNLPVILCLLRTLVHLFFLVNVLGLWIITVLLATFARFFTVTTFLMVFIYSLFFGATFVLISFYSIPHGTHYMPTSTIIPCISSIWYKFYTLILIASVLILFVISCTETWRTPCGVYTSYPGLIGGIISCSEAALSPVPMIPIGSSSSLEQIPSSDLRNFVVDEGFGIGMVNATNDQGFSVRNFTGMCLGHFM